MGTVTQPAERMAKSACTHSARLLDRSATGSPARRASTSRPRAPAWAPRARLPPAPALGQLGGRAGAPLHAAPEQPPQRVVGHVGCPGRGPSAFGHALPGHALLALVQAELAHHRIHEKSVAG